MCVVSNMIDTAREQWPPIQTWPAPVPQEMQEIIRRLADIDRKLGAKDCYDPKKEQFLKDLSDRVAKLEKRSKKSGERS